MKNPGTFEFKVRDSRLATTINNKTVCYHCGDICGESHVIHDSRDFCCNGCKTVYEILNENNLCTYYTLEQNPGITLKKKDFSNKFDYLDNPEIQKKIISYQDEKVAKTNFYIPSIHCSSCIWLLENLNKINPAIRFSRINFSKKEVAIDYDPKNISLKELVMLLATLGYEPFISLEHESEARQQKSKNGLIIKIGVAGFSFGNIMLLSFPEYFGFEGIEDIFLQKFISWLIVILSLPVVFYCSTEYFSSAWSGIKQKYVNIDVPISIGILSLFLVSLYYVISGAGQGYFDSLSGLLFFLLIGRWVQSITYEGLSFDRDYRSYFPLSVIRIKNDVNQSVPVKSLKKGDLILIRNNEIVPCDSILVENQAQIDYSFVTGESDPVLKNKGDFIYAGGKQIGGGIRMVVEKTVSQSYLTQLWNNEVFRKDKDGLFQNYVNSISRYFTIVVLLIATLAFFYWYFIDIREAWFVFAAVLIVACPCALSMATPFTLGNALRVFGRNNFYVKNTTVIEKLTGISHIVFDKTGTLTEASGSSIEFSSGGLKAEELGWIKSLAFNSTHPLSRKILQFGSVPLNHNTNIPDFREIEGAGITGTVHQHAIRIGSAKLMEGILNETETGDFQDDSSNVYVSIDNQVRGFFKIQNAYRPGIGKVIKKLSDRYRLSVLSGDHDGERIRLMKYFPPASSMLFRQKPEDKLQYVAELKNNGEQVLMLGDGLNDAGALRLSDVGIAVTEDITSFSPASDAILDGNQIMKLDQLIGFAHVSKKIIIASFVISFLYNIIGLGFAVTGNLTPIIAAILMPLSSISVVLFATFTVNGIAKIKKLI